MTAAGYDWLALAQAVRARRRQLGIPTQEAAAQQAGISVNTWQRLETGGKVSTTTLNAVAHTLGWDVHHPGAILTGAALAAGAGERALRDRYASAIAISPCTPQAIADAVLAVRDEELDRLRAEVARLRASNDQAATTTEEGLIT